MKWMIADGYQDRRTLERRIKAMEAWLAKPEPAGSPTPTPNMRPSSRSTWPRSRSRSLACPNDPDDVKLLSEVAGDKIDEVFIGSCMTNIGHFRAAGQGAGRQDATSRPGCGSRRRPRWTR